MRSPIPHSLVTPLVRSLVFSLPRDDASPGGQGDIFLLAEDGSELLTEAVLNIIVET